MLQTTTTHKQFESLARNFLERRFEIPHSWRQFHDVSGGRTDLVCWPDTEAEVFASLTDYQITVGTSISEEDFETFGREISDEDLARKAMSTFKSLIEKRLGRET